MGPRLLLAWGAAAGRAATTLLGRVEPGELKHAVTDVLARRHESDAFGIFDGLELRLGRGPFLTPTRLEATQLSLVGTGDVRARRDGPRTLYALG